MLSLLLLTCKARESSVILYSSDSDMYFFYFIHANYLLYSVEKQQGQGK